MFIFRWFDVLAERNDCVLVLTRGEPLYPVLLALLLLLLEDEIYLSRNFKL